MRSLANDRSIVMKKADKGSCVVVWTRGDYIAETSKQLNDESVHKRARSEDKILQDLAEKSNGIFYLSFIYIYIYIYLYIYMSIYLHFTLRKIIDKKTDIQNYTIARYQYTGNTWEY